MVLRNFVFFLFVIPVLIKGKKLPCRDEPVGAVKFLLARTFFGLSYVALVLMAVLYIPLSLSVVVVYLQPFWTSILAFFINKESISPIEIVGMIICFAGVVGLTLSAQN
jgi:drug/metabolite transporter (DMT)-like permease